MSTTERDVEEKDSTQRTIFIVVGVISVLIVGGLIYIAKRPGGGSANQQPRLEGALRAGSPDFEKYKASITVDKPEATEGARALGDIVMTLTTTVRNFTGKTLTGLEMRGAVVDLQGNPVKERTVIVIPNNATGVTELPPNKTLAVPIVIEGMSKDSDRANIKMEVTAVKVE